MSPKERSRRGGYKVEGMLKKRREKAACDHKQQASLVEYLYDPERFDSMDKASIGGFYYDYVNERNALPWLLYFKREHHIFSIPHPEPDDLHEIYDEWPEADVVGIGYEGYVVVFHPDDKDRAALFQMFWEGAIQVKHE